MKHLLTILFALALLVPTSFAHAAAIPPLSFEEFSDGTILGAAIPGVRFSVEGGGEWLIGDARTKQYDAPYPNGAFAVDGHGFAWLGQQAGRGQIEFTAGTATYVTAAFSTRDSLVVTAYDRQGQEVVSQVVRANANTGRLDVARLVAPPGRRIAAVLISGTQNRWIMDNLETDAPIPVNPERAEAARLTTVQHMAPNTSIQPGSILTSTLVVTNRGAGNARNATLMLPFDPTQVQLLDARFSREGVWVSRVLSESLEFQTGPLSSDGDVVTATVRFTVRADLPVDTRIGMRATFEWRDSRGRGTGRSNLAQISVDALAVDQPTFPLTATPDTGAAGTNIRLSSAIFVPDEPVALWYDTPAGTSVAIGRIVADADGLAQIAWTTANLPPGTYRVVAQGVWSSLTATATVLVIP